MDWSKSHYCAELDPLIRVDSSTADAVLEIDISA